MFDYTTPVRAGRGVESAGPLPPAYVGRVRGRPCRAGQGRARRALPRTMRLVLTCSNTHALQGLLGDHDYFKDTFESVIVSGNLKSNFLVKQKCPSFPFHSARSTGIAEQTSAPACRGSMAASVHTRAACPPSPCREHGSEDWRLPSSCAR